MQLQPYLFFDGRCEEALDFYRKALGAEVTFVMRYKESPEPPPSGMVPPGSGDKIMHSAIRVGETMILASDGHCSGRTNFQGFSLTLVTATEEEAKRRFAALGEGGKVQMPLAKTFFSPCFGSLADRFGVSWMIYVAPPNP